MMIGIFYRLFGSEDVDLRKEMPAALALGLVTAAAPIVVDPSGGWATIKVTIYIIVLGMGQQTLNWLIRF